MTQVYDTIIVGGGIAGLACARNLHDNNSEFLLISENIGGRILTAKTGNVQYGAYFVGEDYRYTAPYLKKIRRMRVRHMKFHTRGKVYSTWRAARYPLQVFKMYFILKRFVKHYSRLKENCLIMAQKDAINVDQYIKKIYFQTAEAFVREKGVFDIVDLFFAHASYGLLFAKTSELSAFEFLRWMQYLIVPTYEFIFDKDKILAGFEDSVVLDSVKSVKKKDGLYKLKTKKGRFYLARQIVIATPPNVSKHLLGLPDIKGPASAWMYHLKAIRKGDVSADFAEIFYEGSELIDITPQQDGTYLFYCLNADPDLNEYFDSYVILDKLHWNPAFNLKGHVLWDLVQDENLYLIGDHNICGMEDSFICGMFAARTILEKK